MTLDGTPFKATVDDSEDASKFNLAEFKALGEEKVNQKKKRLGQTVLAPTKESSEDPTDVS